VEKIEKRRREKRIGRIEENKSHDMQVEREQ
jgi:hypothetical protein